MSDELFATAIMCMDGRIQEPVSNWIKDHFEVDYVDAITEPGVERMLAEGPDDAIEWIRWRVDISVNTHGSHVIAVVAHHDCVGNPVDEQEHLDHLTRSVQTISSWNYPVHIVSLWVNDQQSVELIEEINV